MQWDIALFRSINAYAGHGGILDALGIFGASFLLPLMGVLLIPASIMGKRPAGESWWNIIIKAGIAGVLGYAIRFVIALIHFRSRPFASLPDVHLLIQKSSQESSFPSGHATAAFAIAFTLYRYDRAWGSAFLIIAGIISISRVFVGVHFVSDVIAGAVVGFFSAWVVGDIDRKEWSKMTHRLK